MPKAGISPLLRNNPARYQERPQPQVSLPLGCAEEEVTSFQELSQNRRLGPDCTATSGKRLVLVELQHLEQNRIVDVDHQRQPEARQERHFDQGMKREHNDFTTLEQRPQASCCMRFVKLAYLKRTRARIWQQRGGGHYRRVAGGRQRPRQLEAANCASAKP
jgi:hypothetical protein